MQVKRQKITLYSAIFLWLTLYGVVSVILKSITPSTTVSTILLLSLFVILIGLVIANRFLVKDDMIYFSQTNEKIFKISSYLALIPIAVLILFDYLVTDNPDLAKIINIIAASFLIVVGLFGVIYFSIVGFCKSKNPLPPPTQLDAIIKDADFEEKNSDSEN